MTKNIAFLMVLSCSAMNTFSMDQRSQIIPKIYVQKTHVGQIGERHQWDANQYRKSLECRQGILSRNHVETAQKSIYNAQSHKQSNKENRRRNNCCQVIIMQKKEYKKVVNLPNKENNRRYGNFFSVNNKQNKQYKQVVIQNKNCGEVNFNSNALPFEPAGYANKELYNRVNKDNRRPKKDHTKVVRSLGVQLEFDSSRDLFIVKMASDDDLMSGIKLAYHYRCAFTRDQNFGHNLYAQEKELHRHLIQNIVVNNYFKDLPITD